MNESEHRAWRALLALGAKETEIGGLLALDVTPIRIATDKDMVRFCFAFHEVAGRSGTVRRHVNRQGAPVFIVKDREAPHAE